MFKADGNEWQNLGYVGEGGISLSADNDELEVWSGKLAKLASEPVTVAIKPEWWSLNGLYRLITGRARYTVPMLRKRRKGHRGC